MTNKGEQGFKYENRDETLKQLAASPIAPHPSLPIVPHPYIEPQPNNTPHKDPCSSIDIQVFADC